MMTALGLACIVPAIVLAAVLFTIWEETWKNTKTLSHPFVAATSMILVFISTAICSSIFFLTVLRIVK